MSRMDTTTCSRPPSRGVPQQPHHLVEEPFLAAQPVHRRVPELLVHRVQVEVDRLGRAEHLGQQVLQVVPQRVVEVRGQLPGGVLLVHHVGQLRVDVPGPAHLAEQPAVAVQDLVPVLLADMVPQLPVQQQVGGQRPQDRPVPDLRPLLGEHLAAEPLPGGDDHLGGRRVVLGQVCVDRPLVRLVVLQPSHVDGLAGAELAGDHPHLGVVGPGGQPTEAGIGVELHELAEHVVKLGPRSIGAAEQARDIDSPLVGLHPRTLDPATLFAHYSTGVSVSCRSSGSRAV